jgi:hypothetical protein
MTVTYLVEVEVPWIVVVRASEEAAAASVTEAGLVAYTVAVEVCLMVVVMTVVDEPVPIVYVRVESEVAGDSTPPGPLTPVERGTMTALVTDAPEFPATEEADGTMMDPVPVAMAEEMMALETELA